MAVRFQLRGGTSVEWTNANPILMYKELGVETDTQKIKIGNGIDAWNNLSYMTQGQKGDTGDVGEPGAKGDPFLYSDFTQAQLNALKVKGDKGDKGEKGDPFIYADFTPTQLANLKGDKGDKGDTGSVTGLTASHITSALGFAVKNLGNVDNLKQMPISNGVLENYREKLVILTGNIINLSSGNVFIHTLSDNTTYNIINAVSGQSHSFTLIIDMGAVVTLTFPASVVWQGGEIPVMTKVNKTYVLTFLSIDGGTTWLGMFGGEF